MLKLRRVLGMVFSVNSVLPKRQFGIILFKLEIYIFHKEHH